MFATLWVAYVAAALVAPAGRIAATLDWGVLTGGLDSVQAWRNALADGSVLRLFSGLFLHADWLHLLG
ncbi:MAG TPA: rhomboid family intramembrane serine protease, partial [Thermomonas sp.]|nr:rhomboid family intramembrane serine protease [Thermomonas sp.]